MTGHALAREPHAERQQLRIMEVHQRRAEPAHRGQCPARLHPAYARRRPGGACTDVDDSHAVDEHITPPVADDLDHFVACPGQRHALLAEDADVVATVHPRDDIRIFRKECVSLARAGYDVVQVVGDGLGDAVVKGVRIVDIGAPPSGRLQRMRLQPTRALDAVLRLQPALVHFHDPELLPVGVN